MTIAQKLTTIAQNTPQLYEAGKAWVFSCVTQPSSIFYRAEFPQGSSLTVDLPRCNGTLTEMFRMTTGLETLQLTVPQEMACKLNYFAYNSSLKEIIFPNGIRVTDFTNFANRSSKLERITGAIDLTESVSNDSCFVSCSALQEVRFRPESIFLSISFKQSDKLSPETVASILAGLAAVDQPQTLSLHNTVKATITQAQQDAMAAKNWSLA